MISRLTGILLEKASAIIVLDVQGVGYEVHVPMSTFYSLPEINQSITLFIHSVYREDAHLLFGFATQDERATFRELIKVSGIGPKNGLGILSVLSADELASSIENENITRLSSVPGIGKKTAERLIIELRGKLNPSVVQVSSVGKNAHEEDIINTLKALGYNSKEALNATKDLPSDIDISEGVKLALQNLVK